MFDIISGLILVVGIVMMLPSLCILAFDFVDFVSCKLDDFSRRSRKNEKMVKLLPVIIGVLLIVVSIIIRTILVLIGG